MTDTLNLLDIERGMVVAPAGCGKTQAIVRALSHHKAQTPILILTHTNAGIAALRQRLNYEGIDRKTYRLATIDGWALRLVSSFPMRSGYTEGETPTQLNYARIKALANTLLASGHVSSILEASYDRIIVDEYQDCSTSQHAIIASIAELMPAVALGDPLQAIFGFSENDPLANWNAEVAACFPTVAKLSKPWRWDRIGNAELGDWLLSLRPPLLRGEAVDLSTAPGCVRHATLAGDGTDHSRSVEAARCRHRQRDQTSLVIGDSKKAERRYKIARAIPGMVTIEPVDLKSLVGFAQRLDLGDGHEVADTLGFAAEMITGVDCEGTLDRLRSLRSGTARKPASDLERVAMALGQTPTYAAVSDLLDACAGQSGSRVYRTALLRVTHRALRLCASDNSVTFLAAAIRMREENRAVGRQIPRQAIGSTLLVKGLEADHVTILNADELSSRNLYVAFTRGARTVTVCATAQLLKSKR